MSDFLKKMASLSDERAAQLPARFRSADLDRPTFPLSLRDFDLIAEIKDSSPAEGVLADVGADRKKRATDYAEGGAAAISVLTEPTRFAGSLAHLEEVAATVAASGQPVMRKDFLVDTRQVLQAKSHGASGVLLIAAMLTDNALDDMLACAQEHSLFVLLEAFDSDDLRRSTDLLKKAIHVDRAAAGQLLVGINTRNLRTLEVDATRLESLSKELPAGIIAVAESGQTTPDDAARVASLGYSMALVGTALMRNENPRALVADMIAAGRKSISR